MTTYIITYDLNEPGQDYSDLKEAIRSYKTYCHLQESVWLIVSENSATEIRANLQRYLDGNEDLFVSKVCAPAAWVSGKHTEWLKKFL